MALLATMFIMRFFNHAQPALLYLVPACLGTPLLLALAKGDLKALFSYVSISNFVYTVLFEIVSE